MTVLRGGGWPPHKPQANVTPVLVRSFQCSRAGAVVAGQAPMSMPSRLPPGGTVMR
ncbi:MAG TPA: hypothetical protein VK453_02005 [Micromonosporaceae bacterium]|nr:hypothetical protein [Micromonosporaceae bacterium]